MKKLFFPVLIAFILWFVMFTPVNLPTHSINFWLKMTVSTVLLIFLAFFIDRKEICRSFRFSWKDLFSGIGSAVVLWGIFWLGNIVSTCIFPFAARQIDGVYAMKNGSNPVVICLLLLFLIGPAEEIFWRGFVQRNFTKNFGIVLSVGLTALIYTLVHLPSFNFMLIMAAMVCGLFWGLLYYYNKNLLTVIISHALWDCAVFILFPIS